mmetsp:Transcript_26138/g.36199  ORF Transcript_26138/g.36199 Transcript_26138/m.36199 type:complete len:97 (-) Transcript_26138:291-581(-)
MDCRWYRGSSSERTSFVTPQKRMNRRQAGLSQQIIPEEENYEATTKAEQENSHINMLTEAVQHLENENTLIEKVVGRELIDLVCTEKTTRGSKGRA